MSSRWHISRRRILQGVGAALALPMLDVMGPTSAKAAAAIGKPPVRLACMFHPNGVYPKAWECKGSGTDFELSEILQPLSSIKDDVVVMSNLENTTGGGHVGATAGFLTGVNMNNRKVATSLDQLVAQRVGHDTRLASIELGTEPPRQGGASGNPISYANTVSWSSPTTRVSPEINPRAAFDRLFRDSGTSKKDALDRKSVIDLVLSDAKQLQRNVSKNDRHKIDEYLNGVRSVEKQVDNAINPPERDYIPSNSPDEMNRPIAGIPSDRGEHVKTMIDLMVLAFWTDTTRVSTFMLAHGFSRCNFTFMGVKGDHHSLSHHKNTEALTTDYTKVSQWYASQLSYFANRLKNIDEGGTSLLENSLIMYGSGLKDGNGHVRTDLPIVLAGQAGGALKTGRRVTCEKKTPLANLHLSMLNRLGFADEKFNTSTGMISDLV
ncbi:MAG: DUF1552 domain-containing protein [Pirellulales bacterium]